MQNLPNNNNIITKKVPKDGVFIGDCPDEILRIIFLNLPNGTSLVEIAIVHQRFKAEALSILYKSIRLRAYQTSDAHYSSQRRHELPAGLVSDPKGQLLRSFPNFCTHVQRLSLKVRNANWYTHAKGHRKLMELLPRIKELTLCPPPWKYDFPVSDQLTTMRLKLPYDFARFRNPNLWPPYLDLKEYISKPSLRNLQFDSQQDRLYYKTIHTGNTRSSNIADLRFINWFPEDVHVLSTVLPSIKRLKNFVIEVGGGWWGPPPPLGIEPMQILAPHDYGRLLQLHNASLEQIVIAYCHGAYLNFDGQDLAPHRASPAMGSLSNYPRLKRLAVPEHFLITGEDSFIHQLLPPNLEELQIQITGARDWERDNVADGIPYYRFRIEMLAEVKKEFLPQLERVVLWVQTVPDGLFFDEIYVYTLDAIQDPKYPYRHNFSIDFMEHMVEIAEMFQKVDIRFEVVLTRNFKRTPFAEYLYL